MPKHTGGKMLLRIEDTDRERSTAGAIDAIIEGLTWLGLDWSGEPVSQYGRVERHREVAEQLLAQGKAYRCYCTPQELEAMRAKAEAEKRPIRYDGTWRDRDPSEAPAGVKPAIRFKAPQEGETVIDDAVQGRVVIPNKDLDDLIILRSDGNPTYNLSVVVDDHDMGVTHIIRGVDHLTNAARQTQIYMAMGWRVPHMTPHPADPRAGRGQAFQAPRRAGRRGLSRHGLPARGHAQLSRPPGLEPWRRGDLLHRAAGRVVRPRRHRQVRRALRFRQAREPQRPLHPPHGGRQAACSTSSTSCPMPRAGRR